MRSFFYILIFFLGVAGCKSPEARQPVQHSSGTFIKESAQRNKKIYEAEKQLIEKLIAENPETTYIASENGFWYHYIVKDTTNSPLPQVGDVVQFTFDIKDLSGREILSKTENGLQTYQIDQSKQELVSGIREGLKLMKAGETVTFIFPSYKAYGYYGIEKKLGTNVPVQSTITLNSIEKSPQN